MVIRRKKKDDMSTLGGRLRVKRKEKGLTQEQLAAKADTSQAVIQKIENGKSLRPRKIDVIAKVLTVDPAWLQFGGDNKPGGLDTEAVEVAMAWSKLRDPERLAFQKDILKAAAKMRRRRV